MEPIDVVVASTNLMWGAIENILDGLSEEELLWEPVDACWSIRRDDAGAWRQDWMPAPPVEPFTTIAWRLAHIGQSMASHARRLFGEGTFSYATYEAAGSVEGAHAFLEESFGSWRAGIAGAGERLRPELVNEILSFNYHHLGHAKEIDTIRQLFRAQQPRHDDPFVAACLAGDVDAVRSLGREEDMRHAAREQHPDLVAAAAAMGHWDVVEVLLDLGWPVDGESAPTALHHAAGSGAASAVRLLLAHGADPERRDPAWNATPKGWAEYFGNAAAGAAFS